MNVYIYMPYANVYFSNPRAYADAAAAAVAAAAAAAPTAQHQYRTNIVASAGQHGPNIVPGAF